MIIKSQNKDLVVDTYGNDFRMFCGPDGRYGIETRAGVVGVYKTKKKVHMGYRTNKELWARQENNIYHRIGSSEKEYQANEFAAAFLMPASEYLTVLKRIADGNVVDTSKIAEYFNVSVEVASNRGKFLGYLRW